MPELPLDLPSIDDASTPIEHTTVTAITPFQFENAIYIVDDVSGTEEITRLVETETGYHLRHDMPLATWDKVDVNDISFTVLVQEYVATIALWLEDDGAFYDKPNRRFAKHPSKIAKLLVEYGHNFATASMVREAQKLKRNAT